MSRLQGRFMLYCQWHPHKSFQPTWSVVRYYFLKYKKHAQNNQQIDLLKNDFGKLVLYPEECTGMRTGFNVSTREIKCSKRKLSNSKWLQMSRTHPRYRDKVVRSSIAHHTSILSLNSSRLFHSSSQLPKSDNINYTVDSVVYDEDFTQIEEPELYENRFVPKNTNKLADTSSSFQKIKYLLKDKTGERKSTPSDHQYRKSDIQLCDPPNFVLDSSHTCIDELSPYKKEEKFQITEIEKEIKREKVTERNRGSVMFSESGNNEKRLNEMEPYSICDGKVDDTGKVLKEIDKECVENHRKIPPVLPLGNVKAKIHKNRNNDLAQEKKKRIKKEKDHKTAEKKKNIAHTIGGQKSVEEEKKEQRGLDSKLFEGKVPVGDGEKVSYGDGNKSDLSDKNSVLFKTLEDLPSSIAEAVAQYRLKPLTEGYTCLVTRCPKLPKRVSKGKKYGKLYINATSGHFQCDECEQYGSWAALQHNLDNIQTIKKQSRLDFPCMSETEGAAFLKQGEMEATSYLNMAVPLNTLEQNELEFVLEKFGCENLPLSTFERYNVKYDIEGESLLLPYYLADGTLISTKKVTAYTKEGSNSCTKEQEFTSPYGKSHLFGWNQISKDDDTIILTASEFDVMAVTDATQKKALALPFGISSLPIETLPALERFKKILLWFGNDLLSWNAAKNFAKKLNGSRCYVIRPTPETPAPYRALQQGLSLKKIIKSSHQILHESIVDFSVMKSEVYSELANLEIMAGTEWKRYTPLNKILKGHRRGELTVFTGPTGSGKTTFMSEYSLDLCESGVRTLWGSFEIPNVKLAKVMLTQFAKKNLSTHLEEFDHWSRKFEHLPLFFMTFHGHQAVQSVLDAMTHAVYVHDIDHIIVDNLQFMMGAMDIDKFFMQDRIISSFRNFATTMNCHITIVIHPRKEKEEELSTASVYGSAKATQEADNILILQDKRNTNPRSGKYIQVVKNRYDGDLGKMLLKFNKDTYTFSGKEINTHRLRKRNIDQENILQNTETEKNDQSERTPYTQKENSNEQLEADFSPGAKVKTLDYDTVDSEEDLDEDLHRTQDSEENEKERLSY